MLTGKELGAALASAVAMKGVTKKALADAMGVTPASIQDWIKYGRIAKSRITALVDYFSDTVPLSHWGLDFGQDKKDQRLDPPGQHFDSTLTNIPVLGWPFSFDRRRYDALPARKKRTIELLVLGQISEWESDEENRQAG